MKIGFFDSGMGGLSVLHEALCRLPEVQYLYYADEEHVPYGERSKEEIITYVDQAVAFMMKRGAEAIVIACNTATSAAIEDLRGKYSVPVIGMEPAIKKAIDLYGTHRVLATATPVTVRGEKMKHLIERVDQAHLVDLIPLPMLVRFAEQQEFETPAVEQYLKNAFSPFDLSQYASIVLGCTHFNYFKDSFRKILPEQIQFVDGNAGTIHHLSSELHLEQKKIQGTNNAQVEYYYSGQHVENVAERKRIECYLKRLDRMKQIQ